MKEFLLTSEFAAINSLFGLLVDIVLLGLSFYTLYITKFSKKIVLVAPFYYSSMYFGTKLGLTLMNKTLHAIPVQYIFVLKRYENKFFYISFAQYPGSIAIDSWNVARIETEPFTSITSWKNDNQKPDYHEIFKDSVIGMVCGDDLIWIKSDTDAPLKEAKVAYAQKNYQLLTVHRQRINETVVSDCVDCIIKVKVKDINGQYELKKVFGVFAKNENVVNISEPLFGFYGFRLTEKSKEAIVQAIHVQLNIDKGNIWVALAKKKT